MIHRRPKIFSLVSSTIARGGSRQHRSIDGVATFRQRVSLPQDHLNKRVVDRCTTGCIATVGPGRSVYEPQLYSTSCDGCTSMRKGTPWDRLLENMCIEHTNVAIRNNTDTDTYTLATKLFRRRSSTGAQFCAQQGRPIIPANSLASRVS